jgi:gliding motility-associated-like protein
VLNVSANQLCSGDVVTVHASGAQYYTWSPQNGLSDITGQFVTATPMTSTIYTVSGINSNGTVSCFQQVYFPLTVLPKAQANLVSYKRICEGETAALSVSGGDTYIWQPAKGLNKTGGSRVNAKPDLSTVYTVQSSFGGNCVATNTVMVEVLEKPIVDAGRDTTFNADQPMTIAAKGDGSLQWIFGDGIVCNNCGQTAILPRISNCYRVEATNSAGCKSSDDVCVTVTENFSAFFPNSFTPNGDGLNDVFLILGQGISDVKLDIYNKWGERLFSSNDQDNGWDGTLKGLACDAGVYTYNISYKGLNNKHYSKTGSITLVR